MRGLAKESRITVLYNNALFDDKIRIISDDSQIKLLYID